MATPHDLLKTLGIPSHEVPDVGSFLMGLDGVWRHTCTADFPFQSDVELIFDMTVRSPQLPPTMPLNVTWIQEHLADIWNTAALAINNMMVAKELELDGDFHLEPLHFNLPDLPVQTSDWSVSIEPSGLGGSFDLTFQGLSVIDQQYNAA